MHHVLAKPTEAKKKKALTPLDLELQMVISCRVDAGFY